MAQILDQDSFSCSICLDPLKDPVTIPCGHSYCMMCIKAHWDEEDRKHLYSCPQCRKTFSLRPKVQKSTVLAELVEGLKKTGLRAAPADHCYAGPQDVACDICSRRKLKALKSCLVCLVSYCGKHLQPHYDVPQLKKHKLVEPSKNLQENICSRHDEVMKMFCRTDRQSICYLCSVDEHKGHDTVSAAAERSERQKEVNTSRLNIQQRIQEREKDVEVLQQEVEAINGSADKAVEDSEKMMTKLIRLIEKQVRSQQQTQVNQYKEVEKKLQQEIVELKRKDSELERLSHTEDHNHFLHSYPSLSALSPSASSIQIHPLCRFDHVTEAVSQVRDTLQDTLRGKCISRAELLQHARQITLDPNTAHKCLLLSEMNRKATFLLNPQSYSTHPARFTAWQQVLSRESLTGRCYWEVERRGGVYIAVAYKNIRRSGGWNECVFGRNDNSWALYCDNITYEFWNNNVQTSVSGPPSSKIGVYLDHRAGILSFYNVCETMSLLHSIQTTFTEPLYAGVCFYMNGISAEFCKLKYRKTFRGRLVGPV